MMIIYQHLFRNIFLKFLVHIKQIESTKEAPFCILTIIPCHINTQWPNDGNISGGLAKEIH